jgi:hypothetical protein
MDKLTGSHDNNANSSLPNQKESDSIRFAKNPDRKIDSNSILPFLEGGFNNPRNRLGESSLGHLSLASDLDPTKISDEDFFRASRQLNNEDFVRAAYLAYLKQAVTKSEMGKLIGDIEGHKDGRRFFLRRLRNSSRFWTLHSQVRELPIIKPLGEVIEKCWFYLLRLLRKIIGIQRLEILRFTNLVMEQDELLLGACIDKGRTKYDDNPSKYIVGGWVLTKDSQPCTIRLVCNRAVIAEGNLTVYRPDVTRAYCLTSSNHNWGYQLLLDTKDLPDQGIMLIQANFANGSMVVVGSIQFRKF